MTPAQFASALAHLGASKYVENGIPAPDSEAVAMAIIEDAGVRFVVSITRYEGPARFFPAVPPSHDLPSVQSAPAERPPSDIQDTILQAASRTPVTMKRLASLSGYSYTKHFRDAIAALEDAGKLIRDRRGIRLA